MSSSRQQVEDIPELLQLIQLHLSIEEAACTSVLSKAWLHAWSTLPTLRFSIRREFSIDPTRTNMKLIDMDRTLKRYIRDNIPIERFDLGIDIDDQESADLVEKCIRTMITNNNSTLKEVCLTYKALNCRMLTDLQLEILSCENLTKLTVLNQGWTPYTRTHHPVIIKCVSLQELNLYNVNITQELLDGILCSCRLLVKIALMVEGSPGLGLNTIKVTNLPCLYHLWIHTTRGPIALEINHLPNLRVFDLGLNANVPFNAHSISLGSSLKELSLRNMDDASLDMIESVAPLLESLTLDMTNWQLGSSLHFTCASIKRLSLTNCYSSKLTDIKVYASNLLFFCFDGATMPSLLFPLSTLIKETTFRLALLEPVDVSFLLKMRAALAISSNCDLHISTYDIGMLSSKIDIADLRTRLPFPRAMNVQRLFFQAECEELVWERCSFIDALFEICHPNHVIAMRDHMYEDTNHFCKVMLTEVLEKKKTACWLRDLEHVQIRPHEKWETLTNSHKSFLEGPSPFEVDFKLEWR